MKTKIVIFISLIVSLFTLTGCAKTEVQKENYKIVTSFYPMYIIARNITDGANNVQLVNMTEQNTGCIHDYTLTTNDMKKIENADIFIQNGLGLEIFMDKIFTIYPNLKVLDASINIKNVIKEDEVNPHVWTSIENYINQVKEISQVLIQQNSENKQIYEENTEKYIKDLEKVEKQYEEISQKLNGQKAICLNEALEYLAKDIKLEYISLHTDHDEDSMSAESIKNIINKMNTENIKIILIGKDDSIKNAEILANETNAKIYKLDTVLTGATDKNAYIDAANRNLEVLKSVLGDEE